jgi:hypothetical protein
MMFRFKVASLTALLAVALVAASAAPVAATQPTVRIPTSAADWASFTPAEKTSTMKWVWAQKDRMVANGTWTWTEATGADTSSAGTTGLASTLTTVSGSVNCGIKTNAQAWGTYATGWANVSTTASVFSLDTGLEGIDNKFWHNSTLFNHGWGAGGGGTYVYAESAQDFKFPWDTVTWQVQSWGSVQTTYHVFLFKNRYCGKTVAG